MRYLLAALLLLGMAGSAIASANPRPTDEDISLPIHLTDEERLRLHEIGTYQRATDPPPGPVRNCAEWEPTQGVLIRYPLGLPWDLIRDYADHTTVYCLVSSGSQAGAISQFTSNGVDMANVQWLVMSTNSIWTRDYGPWYVFDANGDQAISDHPYNRPRPLDDAVNWNLGAIFGIDVYGHDVISTGGNYMTDGHGISFSTDLVWNENPGLTAQDIEAVMADFYGLHTYHVVPDISPTGIHHIDTWAKLLDEETILVKQVDPGRPEYDDCEDAAAYLATLTSSYGRPYRIGRMYCPPISGGGVASYTNSLILNDRVYVPLFNLSQDATALATYEALMPGYTVVGYDGQWLSDDAIHCRGKGVMDIGMLYVDTNPLDDVEHGQGDHRVAAFIKSYSGADLVADSLLVNWRLSGETSWTSIVMTSTAPDSFLATIPEQPLFSTVEYYVSAVDQSLPRRRTTRPWVAPAAAYAFEVTPGTVGVEMSAPVAIVPRVAPNPFRSGAGIHFVLDAALPVSLSVFGPDGRQVARIVSGRMEAGSHRVWWDGRTDAGTRAAPGVYLFRLRSGDVTTVERGVLVR